MHKIIVITGPTAVGKTKLSIELAKKYDGEIINADAVGPVMTIILYILSSFLKKRRCLFYLLLLIILIK